MSVPEPWEAVLLALAAYRTWRLIALDTIIECQRKWVIRRTSDKVDTFLLCPWCMGFWMSGAWYGLWQWQPKWTLVAAGWPAISAAVGVVAKLDDE